MKRSSASLSLRAYFTTNDRTRVSMMAIIPVVMVSIRTIITVTVVAAMGITPIGIVMISVPMSSIPYTPRKRQTHQKHNPYEKQSLIHNLTSFYLSYLFRRVSARFIQAL